MQALLNAQVIKLGEAGNCEFKDGWTVNKGVWSQPIEQCYMVDVHPLLTKYFMMERTISYALCEKKNVGPGYTQKNMSVAISQGILYCKPIHKCFIIDVLD